MSAASVDRRRRRRGATIAIVALIAVAATPTTSATAYADAVQAPAGVTVGGERPDHPSLRRRDDGPPTMAEIDAVAREAPVAAQRAGGVELMESTRTRTAPCPDDATFLCGTVPVPLDRRHPDGRVVNVHIELFPHTGPRNKADGAVFVTCGGPGCSVTRFIKYGFAFFELPHVAETRDLVFIDQRGVGLSDAIDCPVWQAGGPFYESAAACHDQLGDTANLYSTTDVADDLDDVRRALRYDDIDLFGGSYAGNDMITYVLRHREHVRSIAVASPALVVDVDPFYPSTPEATPAVVAKICGRSPACAAANPDPARSLARLAHQLRANPLSGAGVDSSGGTHQVTVTENLLAQGIIFFRGATIYGPGEIAQAAAALRRGDPVPLLRLGSDVDPANGFSSGDVRQFSAGHSLARLCVDTPLQWDKTASPQQRQTQYATALAAQPSSYGPFSRDAWAAPGYLGYQPYPCISSSWQDRPPYRSGDKVTGVPALVLGGEYDLNVPESDAKLATNVLVGASYIGISGAPHDPEFYSCGPQLVQRFITTLAVGDTSCAATPAVGVWMPGSFPTTVADTPPATQASGPRAPGKTRRLATATAWTVLDSIEHNFIGDGHSVGLRGGTLDWTRLDDGSQWTLDHVRFTNDLAVSGLVVITRDNTVNADVTVDGPNGTTAMHISGPFRTIGADMTITIDVNGQPATFTIPAY
jgi:pimeloyl-ACP methyl ester carboxylesterase